MAEIPSRFYEIVIGRVENHGKDLVMNLDTLRETKSDPRVGSVILQELLRLQNVVLHSDFCGPKDLL